MLSEDKVTDILFKLTMLGFEEEYDEKKDNLKSYLKEDVMHSKRYLEIAGDIRISQNQNHSKTLKNLNPKRKFMSSNNNNHLFFSFAIVIGAAIVNRAS